MPRRSVRTKASSASSALLFAIAIPMMAAQTEPCAQCHSEIVKSYSATPMAHSSGRVSTVPAGSFRHQPSAVQYDVDSSGNVHMSRGAGTAERKLDFYIGSGAEGRSYLSARDGFLFEAPLTWYTRNNAWAASPGYEPDHASRWNRAVEPSCLFCHASGSTWRESTQNRYGDPPFDHDGIACERCHGAGDAHAAGKGAIVNPAKLDPARRDSVCSQCHLSGEARILRTGKQLAAFRPGDRLTDFAAYFVPGDSVTGSGRIQVNSHVEKLAQSGCKRGAGDKLACISCHDPHRVPAVAERAAYFRGRCLTCHDAAVCKRGFDCTSCHMPKLPAADAQHGVFTDHSIPRVAAKPGVPSGWRLRGFSAADTGDRELGLAYAEVAARTGDSRQQSEALRLLSGVRQDPEVETRLGYLLEQTGAPEKAAALYEAALREDPNRIVAMVNLGRLLGSQGFLDRAIALWRSAMERNPCLEEAGANLQVALRAKGDTVAADAIRKNQSGCIF